MARIANIQVITQETETLNHVQCALEACQAGATWLQLRVKDKDAQSVKAIALEVKAICQQYAVVFILNDFPEIALEVQADGVHLGKTDANPADVRKMAGPDFIIGGTANDFSDIQKLAAAKVDYIGLGPFRFTDTKKNLSPILGLQGYETLVASCKAHSIDIPIVAIGGIVATDVAAILETGIHGIAISSAINLAADKQAAYKAFA